MKGENRKKREFCPYCEEEIVQASFPYCQTCKVTIFKCPSCRKPLPKDTELCPHCGAKIRDVPARGGD